MPDINLRRGDLLCGRLIAMPTSNSTNPISIGDTANVISVDFPAMPDVIDLVRSTDYMVTSNPIMPDGIHVYRGTKPLEIPFSFSLHSFDDLYCKQGALSLIQLAARLHSFTLPISAQKKGYTVIPKAPSANPTGGQKDSAALQSQASSETVWQLAPGSVGGVSPPVTCWLHLLWAGQGQPGISAYGYVRDVSAKLKGPWLRGPKGSFNLPTSGDFSFTFMHHPGHGNFTAGAVTDSAFPSSSEQTPGAYADYIKDNFYSTRGLVDANNYQGYADNPSNSTGLN